MEDALTQLAAKMPQVEDQCSGQGTLANPTISHRRLSGTNQSLAGQRLTRHKMRVIDVRLIRIAYHRKTTQKMERGGNVLTDVATGDRGCACS